MGSVMLQLQLWSYFHLEMLILFKIGVHM